MKQIFLVSLFVLAGACGDQDNDAEEPVTSQSVPAAIDEFEEPAPSTSYAEAHAAAVEAIEIAASRGHAWSTADVLLEEGAAAAAAGDDKLAIQLTDKARVQAELSIRQAEFEEGAWTERVLSD